MATRGLLVDQLSTYISNHSEITNLIEFIRKYKITELCIYTGGVLPDNADQLNDLIKKARIAGVDFIRIAAGSESEVDRVLRYIPTLDGLWLEYEWWNNTPRDFSRAIEILKYMREKSPARVTIGAYIGWIDEKELQQLVNTTDKLFIHAYVDSGNRTYSYTESRLNLYKDVILPKGVKRAKFAPIFSAEWRPKKICDQGRANPEFSNSMCFMGPWMKSNDSALQSGFTSAEKAYLEAEKINRPLFSWITPTWRNKAKVDGFYFFAYTHARDALKK